jgi:hypothetical protein
LEKLQALCRDRGVDKLAITDHNTAKAALEMARLYPMWIIPGEEIMTTKGEILAWYIQQEVSPFLSPDETISFAAERGCIMTCGSDAHIPMEYGRCVMKMPPFANTADGFRNALRTAMRQEVLSNRLVHFGSFYAKWIKRLIPSLRPG